MLKYIFLLVIPFSLFSKNFQDDSSKTFFHNFLMQKNTEKKIPNELFKEFKNLKLNMVRKYATGNISFTEKTYVDSVIEYTLDKLETDKNITLSKILGLKNHKIAKKVFKDSVIHLLLTKDTSVLFRDSDSFFNNIISRSILLAAIAERETGSYEYNPFIFSSTLAFGTYQINGNTLGMSFLNIMKTLNLTISDFSNINYRPDQDFINIINSSKYEYWCRVKYSDKKRIKEARRYLQKKEKIFVDNMSAHLFEKMDIHNIYNKNLSRYLKKLSFYTSEYEETNDKKYLKKITFYKNKIRNIRKSHIKKIHSLFNRIVYGIEQSMPKEIRDIKDPMNRRLKILEISASLIESSLRIQGVFSLVVAENKYRFLVSKGYLGSNRKLSLETTSYTFALVVGGVTKWYNAGEHKEIYSKKAKKQSLLSFNKAQKIL